jgi:hypothetical protein
MVAAVCEYVHSIQFYSEYHGTTVKCTGAMVPSGSERRYSFYPCTVNPHPHQPTGWAAAHSQRIPQKKQDTTVAAANPAQRALGCSLSRIARVGGHPHHHHSLPSSPRGRRLPASQRPSLLSRDLARRQLASVLEYHLPQTATKGMALLLSDRSRATDGANSRARNQQR